MFVFYLYQAFDKHTVCVLFVLGVLLIYYVYVYAYVFVFVCFRHFAKGVTFLLSRQNVAGACCPSPKITSHPSMHNGTQVIR
jgi:hypothetical protein